MKACEKLTFLSFCAIIGAGCGSYFACLEVDG